MLNDVWQEIHMAQFFTLTTARAKYLMAHSDTWSFMWGYARVIKELPR